MKLSVSKSALSILLTAISFSVETNAAPIYSEVLNGNGETRILTTRTFTAPASGRYLLTLKNGTRGPRMIEQCETEDTVEEKRQCLFDNLTEKIDQDFTRIQDALIYVNNVRVRNPLAPNEKTITKTRGLLSIPVNLVAGANQIRTDLLGYSSARLEYSLEAAPETASPPLAFFLLNRNVGTTAQTFTLNARESFSPDGHAIIYKWLWGDEPAGTVPGASTVSNSHTYAAAGIYNAQLIVTDTVTSQTATFATELVVKAAAATPVNEKPKPVIQWALDGSNPYRVMFDGSQSTDDDSISTYTWRFTNQAGVSQTVTGSSVNYLFSTAGSYIVRLTVKDNAGLSAAVDRVISVAPLSTLVADEILFSEKTYYGTVSTEAITTETLNLPVPQLARLRIKNADGLEHPVEDCGLIAWPTKISCLYSNLVNRTYLSLYRVNSANVYVNGRKVTDATSINKQKASFETVVALSAANTIEIRVKGWPTAFVSVELQSLEQNVAPVAHVTFNQPTSGVPKTVEFNAATSTDANDQVMSYRFQAKLAGSTNYTIDSDWQAAPIGFLTFNEGGTFDILVSARDKFGAVGSTTASLTIVANQAPTITSATYLTTTDVAPFRVRVDALGADADPGDSIQYSFAFSNGQTVGYQTSGRAFANFDTIGEKSVTVTVRDSTGATASRVFPISVTGNRVPIARYTFAPSRAGYSPLTITFDASTTTDADGPTSALRYFWFFGDGTPEVQAGAVITHTFQNPGEFFVTLSVADGGRALGQSTRPVFAWRTTPPVPRYVYSRVANSFQINFDASTSTPGDSSIARYTFDYGDGSVFTTTSPLSSYTFRSAAVYSVALKVYDQEGDANITSQNITVFNGQKPTANINLVSSDNIAPASFTFDATGSVSPNTNGTINAYRWTLPDGSVLTTPSITYNTAIVGNFDIRLEVRDSFGFWSDVRTQTFSAVQGALPIARIQVDRTEIALGEVIHLSGLNSTTPNANANLATFEWTTPNGTKLYGPEVTSRLSSTGLRTITLRVTDSKGYVSNLATVQINVRPLQAPTAVINLATNGSTAFPLTGHVNGLGSITPNPGATITGYEWRVTAPTTPTATDLSYFGASVDIVFPQSSTWTIALRVFDSAGGTSPWVTRVLDANVNRIPFAVIGPFGLIDTAPADMVFDGRASSDPDSISLLNYHWLFSDGGEAFGPTPMHRFENPGTYTVTLRVQDNQWAWSDPVTITVRILVDSPTIIIAHYEVDSSDPMKFDFRASQSTDADGIASYRWTEGTTALSTSADFSHTFTTEGLHTVGLEIRDSYGNRATKTFTVLTSENSLIGFRSVSAESDVDTIQVATLSDQSDVILNELPAKMVLVPEFLGQANSVQFEWIINGVNNGISSSLPTTIIEAGTSTVELVAKDGDSIVGRRTRQFVPDATACDDEDSVCISVPNALNGIAVPSQDLIFQVPLTEDITAVGNVIITSADGTEFDLSDNAGFSSRNVLVPGTVVETVLRGKAGPYSAFVDVLTANSGAHGKAVYFNVSNSSLYMPTDLQPARLTLSDANIGRILFDETVSNSSSLRVPHGVFDTSVSQLFQGKIRFAEGSVGPRPEYSTRAQIVFASEPDGVGNISSTIFTQSAAAATFSAMGTVSALGAPINSSSGIVGGVQITSGDALTPEPMLFPYSASTVGSFNNQNVQKRSFSINQNYIPWESIGDGTSPLNSPIATTKTLECKAFEIGWLKNDRMRLALAGSARYYTARKTMYDFEQLYASYEPLLEQARIPLRSDAVIRQTCSPGVGSSQDACYAYIDNAYTQNSTGVPASSMAKLKAWSSIYYQRRSLSTAEYNAAYAYANTFVQSIYGPSETFTSVGAGWSIYEMPSSHDFKVTMTFTNQNGRTKSYAYFSSNGLMGDFVAPVQIVRDSFRVNPFDESTTKSVKFPITIPPGTTGVRFSVEPKNGLPEMKSFYPERDGFRGEYINQFSAACRIAEEGYSVKTVEYSPSLTNPSLTLAHLDKLRDYLNDSGLQILTVLSVLPSPNEPDNLSRTLAYISRSLYSVDSILPVDLDLAETGLRENPLWAKFGSARPTEASFNHVVKVDVTHPANDRPSRVDLFVDYQDGSPISRYTGNLIIGTATAGKTSYRIDVPLSEIIANVRSRAIENGMPNGRGVRIEFSPVLRSGSQANIFSKVFAPRLLFNARYSGFTEGSGSKREYYSGKSSSMVSAEMARVVKVLDTIGVTSATPGHLNDLRINDASLPFGRSFEPLHGGHADGHRLDIRTFGVSDMPYETVVPEDDVNMFKDNTRYDDIALLIRASRISAEVNAAAAVPLLVLKACVPGALGINPCDGRVTVENCLFIEEAPAAGTICKEIHDEIENSISMARIRKANRDLSKWAKRNIEALDQLAVALPVLNIPRFEIHYSDGSNITSKQALALRVNAGASTKGLVTTDKELLKEDIPSGWNFSHLKYGAIPATKLLNGAWAPTLYLLDGEQKTFKMNSGIIFRPERALRHFNHFHLDAQKNGEQ